MIRAAQGFFAAFSLTRKQRQPPPPAYSFTSLIYSPTVTNRYPFAFSAAINSGN